MTRVRDIKTDRSPASDKRASVRIGNQISARAFICLIYFALEELRKLAQSN